MQKSFPRQNIIQISKKASISQKQLKKIKTKQIYTKPKENQKFQFKHILHKQSLKNPSKLATQYPANKNSRGEIKSPLFYSSIQPYSCKNSSKIKRTESDNQFQTKFNKFKLPQQKGRKKRAKSSIPATDAVGLQSLHKITKDIPKTHTRSSLSVHARQANVTKLSTEHKNSFVHDQLNIQKKLNQQQPHICRHTAEAIKSQSQGNGLTPQVSAIQLKDAQKLTKEQKVEILQMKFPEQNSFKLIHKETNKYFKFDQNQQNVKNKLDLIIKNLQQQLEYKRQEIFRIRESRNYFKTYLLFSMTNDPQLRQKLDTLEKRRIIRYEEELYKKSYFIVSQEKRIDNLNMQIKNLQQWNKLQQQRKKLSSQNQLDAMYQASQEMVQKQKQLIQVKEQEIMVLKRRVKDQAQEIKKLFFLQQQKQQQQQQNQKKVVQMDSKPMSIETFVSVIDNLTTQINELGKLKNDTSKHSNEKRRQIDEQINFHSITKLLELIKQIKQELSDKESKIDGLTAQNQQYQLVIKDLECIIATKNTTVEVQYKNDEKEVQDQLVQVRNEKNELMKRYVLAVQSKFLLSYEMKQLKEQNQALQAENRSIQNQLNDIFISQDDIEDELQHLFVLSQSQHSFQSDQDLEEQLNNDNLIPKLQRTELENRQLKNFGNKPKSLSYMQLQEWDMEEVGDAHLGLISKNKMAEMKKLYEQEETDSHELDFQKKKANKKSKELEQAKILKFTQKTTIKQ